MVQRSEWPAAHDAAEIEANHYGPADFDGHGHEIVEVDGEHDLFGDGSVLLLPTFGHTPGHQSVLLRAESGDVVLCADACYFLAWIDTEESPPHGRDKEQELQSLRRLRALRDGGARLVPGHDAGSGTRSPTRRSTPLERLLPSPRGRGMGGDAAHLRAWNHEHQHGGPPAALLARAMRQVATDPEMMFARLTFDLLGPVPVGPLSIGRASRGRAAASSSSRRRSPPAAGRRCGPRRGA